MSLWVQYNYRRVKQYDLSPYWFLLEPSPPARESRVSRVLVKRGQGRQENKPESPNSLFLPGVQIVERRRQIHEEKNEGRQLNSLPTDRHALLSGTPGWNRLCSMKVSHN